MTGFLCALGGVCLQQRSTPGPATYSPPMGPSAERKQSMISMGPCDMSNPLVSASSFSSSASNETPVSRFLDRLLSLLVCGHDRVGLHIRTNVKDLLGLELSPALYPMLFNKLRNSIGRFFDAQGPVRSSVVGEEGCTPVHRTCSVLKYSPVLLFPGSHQRHQHSVCGADHRHHEEPVGQPHGGQL